MWDTKNWELSLRVSLVRDQSNSFDNNLQSFSLEMSENFS